MLRKTESIVSITSTSPRNVKLLFGAKAIHEFIQTLTDEPVTLPQVYHWIEQGYVPVQRISAKIIGNPRKIHAALAGED
jgi:hypothetical protein